MAAELPDAEPAGLPVTVVIARRPAPGREADLLAWADGIGRAASDFPGHLGAQIFAPAPPERDELVVAFSFASAADLSAWEHSTVRQEWLERSRSMIEGAATTHTVRGFEALFVPEPGQRVVAPPKWKTAAIIALALYPISLLLNWLLAPQISSWNIWLRVAVTTAIVVPFMVWVGVPYLSRWLRGWLHARR